MDELGYNHAIDNVLLGKQRAINNDVVTAIAEKRSLSGLSQLMNSSSLGKAALSMSESLGPMQNPQGEQILSSYQQRAKSFGYQGAGVGVAYYRKIWPLDTHNEVIAQDILNIFLPTAEDDSWEDWGFGLSRGFDSEKPTEFCMCVVFGVGFSDGNALITDYVNEERVKAGVQPLELDYHLRRLARDYLVLDTEPDRNRMLRDIQRCDYAEPMSRIRFDHGGVYATHPGGDLSFYEVARLVADEFLRTRRDTLLRSDWQHVGFAVQLEPVLPPMDLRVPSIMSEYVIAWRLPPNAERPAHFPPPTDRMEQPIVETPRKRRAWWWPF